LDKRISRLPVVDRTRERERDREAGAREERAREPCGEREDALDGSGCTDAAAQASTGRHRTARLGPKLQSEWLLPHSQQPITFCQQRGYRGDTTMSPPVRFGALLWWCTVSPLCSPIFDAPKKGSAALYIHDVGSYMEHAYTNCTPHWRFSRRLFFRLILFVQSFKTSSLAQWNKVILFWTLINIHIYAG